MTIQVELTPAQTAELEATATREARTIEEVLVARAFPTENSEHERLMEIARRKAALAELARARDLRTTPPHLWNVKTDAEFFYAE